LSPTALDRFLVCHSFGYPDGTGNSAIRRTMLPKTHDEEECSSWLPFAAAGGAK